MAEFDAELERQLREGLRPRPSPAGFSDRVMARLQAEESRSFLRLPMMRWAMAAALIVAIALGGYREHQRRLAGERARQQVLLALRITGSALQAVHNKIVSGEEPEKGDQP